MRRSVAPVKLPFSWPNSSRLDQVRRDRAAVERHERLRRRARLSSCSVSATSSLPVPVSPVTSTVASVRATFCDLVVDRLHRRRRADHPAEAPEPAQLLAQRAHLPAQPRRALHVREHLLEPADVDRLGQIVGDAAAHRAHRGVDARVAGHEHEVHRRPLLHQRKQIQGCAIGQLQIGNQEVEVLLLERLARGLERGGRARREPLALDERLHRLEVRRARRRRAARAAGRGSGERACDAMCGSCELTSSS